MITTCHSENAAKPTKKAKNKPTISGLIPGWDSNFKVSSKVSNEVTAPVDDNDSMVQYSGMVGDEEDDDLERVAVVSGKSSKKGTLVCHSTNCVFRHSDMPNIAIDYKDISRNISDRSSYQEGTSWGVEQMDAQSSWIANRPKDIHPGTRAACEGHGRNDGSMV